MPLEPDDQILLAAARGFVSMRMFADANEELERIDADIRHVPEVLALPAEVYDALKCWELLGVVAEKLLRCDPDDVRWIVAVSRATRHSR